MPATNAQKLKIKEGMTLLTIDAPATFRKNLGPLPERVTLSEKSDQFDQVHWFIRNRAEMDKGLAKVLAKIKEAAICWVYFPKGSSGIQTDLNRDTGWESLRKYPFQWVNLISFDDTWSAFGLRQPTEKDVEKSTKPKERPVFDYVDPVKKTVRLPEDFGTMLHKHKTEESFFNSLSFSNKKEYIEWIVSAKRPDTRASRISGSLERLAKGWKNPANR